MLCRRFLKILRPVTLNRHCVSQQSHIFKDESQSKQSSTEDADTFGNYSEKKLDFDRSKEDPEDIKEALRRARSDKQHSSYYIKAIRSHLQNNQYETALNILEERMLATDKVKPDSYVYDLFLSYCGRRGDVKEAFRLYNQEKKRGFFVTGGQYTSLFNACANSSRSHHALEVASKLRRYMSQNEIHKPNIKNYNAMLKAFGRHGDLKTCLAIMDEVLERRGRVKEDTYNFLLQSCISDKNSGFRHALNVWHRMLVNKTDPSVFSFNLMLRAARDCSLGVTDDLPELIGTILKEKNLRRLRKMTLHKLTPKLLSTETPVSIGEAPSSPEDQPVDLDVSQSATDRAEMVLSQPAKVDEAQQSLAREISSDLPNLLAIEPKGGSALRFHSFSTPYHRLLLMGGVTGFLGVMDSLEIKPDMKTFTLLLGTIPPCNEAEEELMSIIRMKKINFDTGFFNNLMKNRAYRQDYDGAKNVLGIMQINGTPPDLTTFGVLALTCRDHASAEQLIATLREAGLRANSQILTPLVRQATLLEDLPFVKWILQVIKEDDVQPDAKLMVLLNDFMKVKSKKLYAVSTSEGT